MNSAARDEVDGTTLARRPFVGCFAMAHAPGRGGGEVDNCPGWSCHSAISAHHRPAQPCRSRQARDPFTRILPLLSPTSVVRQSVVEHVLHRRGLVGSPHIRDSNPALGRYDRQEIDAVYGDLRDLMTAHTKAG